MPKKSKVQEIAEQLTMRGKETVLVAGPKEPQRFDRRVANPLVKLGLFEQRGDGFVLTSLGVNTKAYLKG